VRRKEGSQGEGQISTGEETGDRKNRRGEMKEVSYQEGHEVSRENQEKRETQKKGQNDGERDRPEEKKDVPWANERKEERRGKTSKKGTPPKQGRKRARGKERLGYKEVWKGAWGNTTYREVTLAGGGLPRITDRRPTKGKRPRVPR